jgi:tetratricopeptide (TPR) repeat protein
VIVQLGDNRLFVEKGASLPEAQIAVTSRARFLRSARKLGGTGETPVAARPESPPALPPSPPLSPPSPAAAGARAAGQVDEILSRAQVAFNKGNYPEAIRRGREAIAAGAAASGRLVLGDTYYHMERYADALREYDAALAADPGNAPARRGRDLARAASARASATP